MKNLTKLLFISFFSFITYAKADFDLTKLKNFSIDLERSPPASLPFLACYKKDERELCYIATNHGSDQNSSTFGLVRNTFDDYKPDFVILEGFESEKGLSPSEIIGISEKVCKTASSSCEEPHYSVTLAAAKQIPFIGGEPNDEEVYDKLRYEGYTSNEVFTFFFARLVPQLYRDSQIKTLDDIHKYFDAYLKTNKIGGVTLSWTEYEEWIKRNVSKSFTFSEMVDPMFVAPVSNGTKLQKIANKIEWIRDRHILRMIFDSLLKYKRILVIYGHSHYLTQVDVLEQYLGKATYFQKYQKDVKLH